MHKTWFGRTGDRYPAGVRRFTSQHVLHPGIRLDVNALIVLQRDRDRASAPSTRRGRGLRTIRELASPGAAILAVCAGLRHGDRVRRDRVGTAIFGDRAAPAQKKAPTRGWGAECVGANFVRGLLGGAQKIRSETPNHGVRSMPGKISCVVLHPLGCGRAGQLAHRPSPDLRCRPPHTYFKRTVTPPTAADTSSPTFGPLSCRITPLAFCN